LCAACALVVPVACASANERGGAMAPETPASADVMGSAAETEAAPSAAPAPPPPPAPATAGVAKPRGAARPARRLALADTGARAATGAAGHGGAAEPSPPEAPQQPILIYSAALTMAVFDVAPSQAKIEALTRDAGGFLSHKTNDAIVVRVPAARFHDVIAAIEKVGDVLARNISADDITQEYLDLEVRLKSARAVRERLEQLLGRAAKVEEALAIEREIDRVVAQIEEMEGRLKYMQDRAQYSTITVTFAARPRETVNKERFKLPFPWLDELGLGRLLDLGH
jgi:hypothetical protein